MSFCTRETAAKYTAAMSRMKQLEKKLKRTINKSKYAPINLLNAQAFGETILASNSLCLSCLMHIAHKNGMRILKQPLVALLYVYGDCFTLLL